MSLAYVENGLFQCSLQAGERITSPEYSYHRQTESYSDGRIAFLLAISHASSLLRGPECKILPEFWNCPQFRARGDIKSKRQKIVSGKCHVTFTPDLPTLWSTGQIS